MDKTRDDPDQLPVVEVGTLVGRLDHGNVIRYIRVRRELGQKAA